MSSPPITSPTRQHREEAGPSSTRSSPVHSLLTLDQAGSVKEDGSDPEYQDYPVLDYDEDQYIFDSFDEDYQRFFSGSSNPRGRESHTARPNRVRPLSLGYRGSTKPDRGYPGKPDSLYSESPGP